MDERGEVCRDGKQDKKTTKNSWRRLERNRAEKSGN